MARRRRTRTAITRVTIAFYLAWDAIARDRATFQAWIQTHILDTDDFAGFQRVYAQSQQQVAA